MEKVLDYPERSKWILRVDFRERKSQLLRLALESDLFDVRVELLHGGDYIINNRVVLERKTFTDFALSVIDGRLFVQAAALKKLPERPLILLEGPRPNTMPRVHPKALKGALLSLAVAWRLPVIFSRDPDDSLVCLQLLAEQSQTLRLSDMKRPGFKLRGNDAQRLFVLQGLPGVGPRLARVLLEHFGSIEKVVQASALRLAEVLGCGPKKVANIRKILADEKSLKRCTGLRDRQLSRIQTQ